jgi:pyruvate,water dikinase
MVVWPGTIQGKVRIITSSDKIGEMKNGEILVCPMSDPDYLPAIRKAKAIIADLGGLLCHAAIVARELRIPCIVGTKNATRVLANGDLIEMDGEKGIIKIL